MKHGHQATTAEFSDKEGKFPYLKGRMQNIVNPYRESPLLDLPERWSQELRDSYTSVADLLRTELISSEEAKKLISVGDQFKVRITPYYSRLMTSSPSCPVRLQAIPHLGEADPSLPDWATDASIRAYGRPFPWTADAIGDIRHLAVPRITHRYDNRALLHLSSLCAVYCRFCFRKSHLNNRERSLYEGSLDPAFQYLERHSEIRELILTGGDPLSVSDLSLRKLLERISKLSHIKVVRIHSRMTVTLPCRITDTLLSILKKDWGFQLVLVSHFNHPQEISEEAISSLRELRLAGITLLNQSVLLKGINNSAETLATLFQRLYELGVIPFYLHHPDWTPGTFHFRTSIEEGKKIISEIKGLVSGPSLPQYTLDIPGGYGKVNLLEEIHRKIIDFPERDSPIQGALYEVIPPWGRTKNKSPQLYLDLFSS